MKDFDSSGYTPDPVVTYEELIQKVDTNFKDYEATIRRFQSHSRRPPSPWWDEECKLADLKRGAYQTFKRHSCNENINNYLAVCKNVKNRLRKIRNKRIQRVLHFFE